MKTSLKNRKTAVSLLFAFFALLYQVHGQCPQLVWADEFNGTSLDATKWTPQIGNGCDIGLCGWGNNELQYYTDKSTNLSVSDGYLVITARKERIRSNEYTSARIRSIHKGDFTYGRMEARMKLSTGKGLWPAFWMMPTDDVYGGWPQSGEIDIMESIGSTPNTVHGTLHYGDPYPNNKSTGNKYLLPTGNFNDDFHIFAIEWEPNQIRWYVDGILYSTKTDQDLSPYRWPFDQRFHFILNLAVGGNWPGNPDATTVFPHSIYVDYVRVYAARFPYVNGPDLVEANQTGITYSVDPIQGATYSWSVPAGATIASGQGTSSISVNWGTTEGKVTVRITQSCGAYDYSKNVYIKPPVTYGFTFENFEDQRNITYVTSTGVLTQAVNNPSPAGINTSPKVGKYDRNSSQQYDVLSYAVSLITDATQYSARKKRFFLDVNTNAPPNTLIYIQLENSSTATSSNFPTGRHSRYVAYTSKQNEWERLEFDLDAILDTSVPASGVDRIIFLFASNSFTGHTYYFDNFDSYNVGTIGGDTEAPTAPTNLTSTGKTSTSVSLSWTASTDNVGVTGYDVFTNGNLAGSTTNTSFTVTSLTPSTTYHFTVKAKDAAGNISPASNTLSITTDAQQYIKIEAENYTAMKGVTVVTCLDEGGGLNVASIDNRDYVEYSVTIPTAGTYRVDFRVASSVSTGKFDLKRGNTVLASLTVPNTGGSQVWQTISANANLNAGTQTLRVLATATGFSMNWLGFVMVTSGGRVAEVVPEEAYTTSTLALFPNPAIDVVHLRAHANETIEEVLVFSGAALYKKVTPRQANLELQVSTWPRGLYIFKVRTESTVSVKKIMIQ